MNSEDRGRGVPGRNDVAIRAAIQAGMHLDENANLVLPSGHIVVVQGKRVGRPYSYRTVHLPFVERQVYASLSRVVCWLAHGEPPSGGHEDWVADHVDRDRQNNALDNLRWLTTSQNSKNVGVIDYARARRRGMATLARHEAEREAERRAADKRRREMEVHLRHDLTRLQIRDLSRRWHVGRPEVIRRIVASAHEKHCGASKP